MAASVLEVLITGDATSLKLAFTQATVATKEYQAATQTSSAATKEASATSKLFGQASTLAFTAAKLGVLAFAAVSVKAAVDFNREFTLIAAITNTAADHIGALKDTVLGLSKETAVAPTELAHSLYFLASAGLTSQQQMEALDASAKGAAIGLGDSGDLARITANALNAFSDQGLTASQVMDTLVAAVREGTAEPDAFASALGRVLPIADQAGISFQAVAASLATMSNAGLDVNEGVTALRATLQSLVAPTAQTETAFGNMGLSVDQVVRSMKQDGLITTLRLVSDAAKKATSSTGEYNQMMRHAIPNIRGLAGSLNLLKQDSSKVDEIFQQVKNSTGDMETAFQTTTQSASFQLKRAFQELLNTGMELATVALPPIAAGLSAIAPLISDVLPLAIQVGIAWGAWVAIPPILSGIAVAFLTLRSAVVAASEAVQAMNWQAWVVVGVVAAVAALSALTGNMQGLGIVLVGAGIALARFGDIITETQAKMGAFALAAFAVEKAWSAIQGLQRQTGDAASGLAGTLEQGKSSLADFNAEMLASLGPQQKFLDSVFSSHPNHQAWDEVHQAIAQVQTDILNQNTAITAGTPLLDHYGQILNNTSTLNMQLHGALATVLTDYYKQNGSLAGLNTAQLNAYVSAGKWHQAINMVSDALDKENAALARQAQGQASARTSLLAQDFAKVIPILGTLGMSFQDFQAQATAALNGSADDWKTFSDTITKQYTDAWMQFKQTAASALNFAAQGLSDLGSQASSAADQLSSMTDSSGMSKSALADLQDQAHLTAGEILQSFKDAEQQTKAFADNLLEIAKQGSAGKALAGTLLQQGNTVAAQTIAGAPAALQKQLITVFGKTQTMVDSLSTKLTDAIVGPLDLMSTILVRLARHWGISVDAKTGKAQHDLNKTQEGVNKLTNPDHYVNTFVHDNATGKLKNIQGDVDHLVGNAHKIQMAVNQDVVKSQLANLDSNLNNFLDKKRQIIIGVHTKGNSPMPDEALKQHLFDPMKQAGFKRVGDAYTLPLVIGAHTNDPTTFPGGKGGKDSRQKMPGLDELQQVEQRQLQVLFDIRRELKGGGGGTSAGGTSGTGGTGGTDGTGGRGHGSLQQISPLKAAAAEIVKMTSKSGATLNEGLGVVQRIAAQGLNPAFMRHAVEGVRQELGRDAARQYQQQLRLIDQMTKDSAERRTIARRAAYYAAHPDARRSIIDQQRFMTPLQRSVDNIFQKVYKAGMTPGEAKGVIARVAREGRDPKFIGGAIKDMAKELGPAAAKEFGHSLRSLDASTAHNAKHQQDALDAARDAFKQMTQQSKHMTQQDIKQQQARQEESKQWMADALAYATHNVPKLPRGHTHISVNHHEHRRRQEVRLDRRRFTDSAGYEVDYARGF